MDPQNTIVLIIGTPKKVLLILGNYHIRLLGFRRMFGFCGPILTSDSSAARRKAKPEYKYHYLLWSLLVGLGFRV